MSGTEGPGEPAGPRRDSAEPRGEPALPRAVGTWKRAYLLVIAVLAADILLLWILMRVYT